MSTSKPAVVEAVTVPSDAIAARHVGFVSQATQVEQARAVAEVQAAVIVAQQVPRQMPAVMAAMEEACSQKALADRAFFRFPRGGTSITGPSIHLARELARVFGNIQYGIHELRRDDVGRYSEMQAWAWDVQTNTRTNTTFVVPHKRDKRGGPEVLTELRDIYESNANQGARRVREMIFAILPSWFTERAKSLCMQTLEDGGGKPVAQRVADAVKAFEALGVKPQRLEQRFGTSSSWGPLDLAQLEVVHTSLRQGTVSIDEEFPPLRVTVDELTGDEKGGKP
jgi:hypothetical protein